MTNKEYKDSDIAKAWQKMAAEKFSHSTIKKEDIMTAIKKESNSSIAQLKKGLKHKLYYAAGITLGLILALLFSLSNPDLTILFSIAVAVYLIGFVMMYLKYREIEDGIMESEDILDSMKSNSKLINSVLKREKIWGLMTFVPALIMGILFGEISDGSTIVACFQDSRVLMKMIIVVVLFTPLMFWTTGKMNKKAYGADLKTLEDNIVRMETLQ